MKIKKGPVLRKTSNANVDMEEIKQMFTLTNAKLTAVEQKPDANTAVIKGLQDENKTSIRNQHGRIENLEREL